MFSCRTRGFCPSCHAKRVEEWGESRDWPGASHSPEDCNHGRVRRKLTPGLCPGPRPPSNGLINSAFGGIILIKPIAKKI